MSNLSQKAEGLLMLREFVDLRALPAYIIPLIDIDKKRSELIDEYYFVRPCPRKPRHGVIESIIAHVSELNEKIKYISELMIKHNEEPIIAIQRYVQAKWNIVWNNNFMVIAPDNDGVTAGKTPKITLPAEFPSYIPVDKHKYELELVGNDTEIYFTQIREAPQGLGAVNKPQNAIEGFLNKSCIDTTECKIVIIDSLSDMEVLEKIKEQNTIVIHKNGNLLSHASAWCRQNKLNYLITENITKKYLICKDNYIFEVDNIDEDTQNITINTDFGYYKKQFMDGIYTALNSKFNHTFFALTLPFQAFAAGMAISPETAKISGVFVGLLLKAAVMICLGELRHSSNVEPICIIDDKYKLPQRIEDISHRDYIYNIIYDTKIEAKEAIKLFKYAMTHFRRGCFKTNYGGKSWAKIAKQALLLAKAVKKKSMSEIINNANLLLNLVHNNGWAFNKITTTTVLDLPYNYHKKLDSIQELKNSVNWMMDILQGVIIEAKHMLKCVDDNIQKTQEEIKCKAKSQIVETLKQENATLEIYI